MSVINNMLRNLDARKASVTPMSALPGEVRAMPKQQRVRPVVMWLLPLLAMPVIGWLANEGFNRRASSSAHIPTPISIAAQPGTEPGSAATDVAPTGRSMTVASISAPTDTRQPAEMRGAEDILRVDPQLSVSAAIQERAQRTMVSHADTRETVPNVSGAASKRKLVAETQHKRMETVPASPIPAVAAIPFPHDEAGSVNVEAIAPSVQERLAEEVQRAHLLASRGELAPAEARLRAVLMEAPTHQGARQTLVALLNRQLRDEDARHVLKEGADLTPTDARAVLPYARILAANSEFSAAAEVLARAADGMPLNAEYHALKGAVLQRLARFTESTAEYQTALRLAPSVGAWWIGLGISLENEDKVIEARNAYLQARSTTLSPDLVQFVENNLNRLGGTK